MVTTKLGIIWEYQALYMGGQQYLEKPNIHIILPEQETAYEFSIL